jgi:glutaredoxin
MENILVYTKDNCPKCNLTKQILEQGKVSFETLNVDTLGEAERENILNDFREKGFMSFPIVKTKEEMFCDFRPDKLNKIAEDF